MSRIDGTNIYRKYEYTVFGNRLPLPARSVSALHMIIAVSVHGKKLMYFQWTTLNHGR